MVFSSWFALGLLAYVRQAALSLHRAPAVFCEAMRAYYAARNLPSPGRVLACIDTPLPADVSKVPTLIRVVLRRSIAMSEAELKELRAALRALEAVLGKQVTESDAERVRIRLMLSGAEDLVRRKLGKRADRVDRIEHLNENLSLDLKPFGELAGANWPEST